MANSLGQTRGVAGDTLQGQAATPFDLLYWTRGAGEVVKHNRFRARQAESLALLVWSTIMCSSTFGPVQTLVRAVVEPTFNVTTKQLCSTAKTHAA